MAKKRVNKKTGKRNKRRFQLRAMKFVMYFLAVALPCVWLIGQKRQDSEPMQVAKAFADNLIHARFVDAQALATERSADDIAFYAEWIGSQSGELQGGNARFKVTHAQILLPADTVNVIKGKVLAKDADGKEREVQQLQLTLVRQQAEKWQVDFHADTY